MSFGPAFDAKEQVRQAIDIVDLIGSYAQLRRSGRNFVCLCPWHDDSRPSLQVNPDRQSFKCWVCDYGGDIFSFIMRAENLEFREALELLAERAGIDLRVGASAPDGAGDRPARPEDDKRTLHRVLAWAEEQFHRCLVSAPEGEPGRAYFAERGITDETIRRFHLGYAPQGQRWDWLLERARGTEWTPFLAEGEGRRYAVGAGLLGLVAIGSLQLAFQRGDTGPVSVASSQFATVAVILSVLFNHERMRWWQAVGVATTAIAVALIALGG